MSKSSARHAPFSINNKSDRIRTAVNVLSDGYVAGIVAHLSKDELERYDQEHGSGQHPELDQPAGADPLDSHGKYSGQA